MTKLNKKIKDCLDANVWDGEDRSGSHDVVHLHPDELQELVEEVVDHLMEDKALVPIEVMSAIKPLIEYIEEGEPDLDVVMGELGEMYHRWNGTYLSEARGECEK